MKNISILILMMIVSLSSVFSQNEDDRFKNAVDRYFNQLDSVFPAKYKIKTITISQPEIESYKPYIAEIRHFDKTGNLELNEFFDIHGGITHLLRITPDPLGKLIIDSSDLRITKTWTTIDDRTLKSEVVDNRHVLIERDVYEYKQQNNVVIKTVETLLDTRSKISVYTTEYNHKHLPVLNIVFDSATKKVNKDIFTYSDSGKLLTDTFYYESVKTPETIIVYEYDKEGRLSKKHRQAPDFVKTKKETIELTYHYDKSGRVIKIDDTPNADESGYQTYEYDTAGNVKRFEWHAPNQDLHHVETFTYDKDGHVLKRNSNRAGDGVSNYSYDTKGLVTEVEWESPNENPPPRKYSTKYSYTFW